MEQKQIKNIQKTAKDRKNKLNKLKSIEDSMKAESFKQQQIEDEYNSQINKEKVHRHRTSVELGRAQFDLNKALRSGWNYKKFNINKFKQKHLDRVTEISSSRTSRINEIERLENEKSEYLKKTDIQIEILESQLKGLKETKRRNSILLEQTITKHQTGKWKDWRAKSPEKLSNREHSEIIKHRTNEIKEILENEKKFSVKYYNNYIKENKDGHKVNKNKISEDVSDIKQKRKNIRSQSSLAKSSSHSDMDLYKYKYGLSSK